MAQKGAASVPAGRSTCQTKKTARFDDDPYRRGGDAGERRGEFAVAVGRLDQWGAAEDEQERMAEGEKMTANARIYSIVAKIPRGKVATYGQIAALAGIPREARKVGRALHALPVGSDVPWQRVINAKAEVSRRKRSEAHLLQRQLLEDEGIVFDEHGRVNFKRFRWRP